jgi:hypothetical protein
VSLTADHADQRVYSWVALAFLDKDVRTAAPLTKPSLSYISYKMQPDIDFESALMSHGVTYIPFQNIGKYSQLNGEI